MSDAGEEAEAPGPRAPAPPANGARPRARPCTGPAGRAKHRNINFEQQLKAIDAHNRWLLGRLGALAVRESAIVRYEREYDAAPFRPTQARVRRMQERAVAAENARLAQRVKRAVATVDCTRAPSLSTQRRQNMISHGRALRYVAAKPDHSRPPPAVLAARERRWRTVNCQDLAAEERASDAAARTSRMFCFLADAADQRRRTADRFRGLAARDRFQARLAGTHDSFARDETGLYEDM